MVFEGRHSPVNNMKLSNKTTVEEVVKKLKLMQGVDVYAKKDIPEHLHYKWHQNIGDVLLVSHGEVVISPFPLCMKHFIVLKNILKLEKYSDHAKCTNQNAGAV